MNLATWFRDRAVRKIAKYGVPVALGKLVLSLSGLVTLGILTRHLGPSRFGVIAMYRTVVTVVDMYANFNTWQAVIKYGAEQIAAERPNELRRIIKLAFSIDATTAFLGFAVVVGLAFVIPGTFGWTSREATLCAIYGVTLISKVSGTSDGIFRICDAYRLQAIATSIGAILMMLIVVAFVALGAGFEGCVAALILGEVVSNLTTSAASFWVARKSGYGGWIRTSLGGIRRDHPGLVRFLVATNAQLTVRTTQSEFDMLVIGSVLGRVSVGLYRVVKQLGMIPGRIFMPFEQVLFTELARSAATRDYRGFRRLLRRSIAIAGSGSLVVWIVIAFGARFIVHLVAGPDFVAAADPLRWYLLAMAIGVAATPVMRAMVALGRPGTLFLFDSASLIVLVFVVIAGALTYGLVGVAFAIVAHRSVQFVWSTSWVWNHLRNLERQEPISTTNAYSNSADVDPV